MVVISTIMSEAHGIADDVKALLAKDAGNVATIDALNAQIKVLSDAKAEAEKLAGELSQLRSDYARIKKLATAYPLWRELTELESQRADLGDASPLGKDPRTQFDKLLE